MPYNFGRRPRFERCQKCKKLLGSSVSRRKGFCATCAKVAAAEVKLNRPTQPYPGQADEGTHPPRPGPVFFPICGVAWVGHGAAHFCKLRAGHDGNHNGRCVDCTVRYGPYGMKTRRVPDPVPQARGNPPTHG